jgi:hypothetical protein
VGALFSDAILEICGWGLSLMPPDPPFWVGGQTGDQRWCRMTWLLAGGLGSGFHAVLRVCAEGVSSEPGVFPNAVKLFQKNVFVLGPFQMLCGGTTFSTVQGTWHPVKEFR